MALRALDCLCLMLETSRSIRLIPLNRARSDDFQVPVPGTRLRLMKGPGSNYDINNNELTTY